MSKNKRNKQQDSRERFNEILRQTNSLHRPESPFGNSGRLIAVMRHTESVTDADETVTIPRDEYNNLLAAKTTLKLLLRIAMNMKESAFVSVREILQLISGDSPTDVTADT